MKMIKTFGMLFLCAVISFVSPINVNAKSITGDQALDPIVISDKQSKNTFLSKNCGAKYFRVVVAESGTLKISISSKEIKKNTEIRLMLDNEGVRYDTVTVKYNKKEKKLNGSLTSSSILLPGQYNIMIKTDDVAKKTAFTLKTSINTYKCDDNEPNNTEEKAQKMIVNAKKDAVTYQMMLSGDQTNTDRIDYFTFNLKKDSKLSIVSNFNHTSNVRIILKKKTLTGYEVVNAKEEEQNVKDKNGKGVFSYSSQTLSKGTYYLMVWAPAEETQQLCYNIRTITK